jgi:hypothetical protein
MIARYCQPTLFAVISLTLWGCGSDDHTGHDHDHDHAGHDHDHGDHAHSADYVPDAGEKATQKQAGPNGGRVLTSVEPAVEFLVTDDRRVRLTFLDSALKPIPAAAQSATIIAGDRSAPVRLAFAKDGDSLLSDGTLPEGDDYPTVLQIKVDESAAPVLEKFNLDLSDCPSCDYLEYACICDH